MKSDFLIAVTQLAAERNLPQDMVVSAVEAALASAYRRDGASGSQSNIRVHLDPNTGEVEVYQVRTVVEEVTNELAEITLGDAKRLTKNQALSIGDTLEEQLSAHAAGRIAAQTAKQVVFQRLREAERELVYAEFAEKSGEVYTATVQRSFGGAITMDLNGRASATLPPTEQSPLERYRPGMKLKVIITEVTRTQRGPEIIVSRTHPDLLRRLFEMEVPEIYNGIVEIRGIAREPGSRSKVAVYARQDGVDPVGACVGLRGIRIQNIVNELQGEKIDVIQWSRDLSVYISHALSPAQPLRVDLNEAEQAATIVVPDRQLSLAIGREGQNARLAGQAHELEDRHQELDRDRDRADARADRGHGRRTGDGGTPQIAEAVATAPEAVGEEVEERAAAIAAEEAAIMAELEAEAAATQEAEAEELTGGLSPEEMLALESLDQVDEEIEEIIVEEVEEAFGEDDIWKVPEPIGGGPTIRFAEDILGAPQPRRGGGRRRGGAGPRRGNAPNRGGGRRPGGAGTTTTGSTGGDDFGG